MTEDIPDAPDLEAVEIVITIHDEVYTHETYTTTQLLTQRELETSDPSEIARTATEMSLNGALRQYLEILHGKDGDQP